MGLRREAVASFARPGHESRHNRAYFTGEEYVGLGCAARSMQFDEKPGVVRRFNSPKVGDYLADPVGCGRESRVGPVEHLEERLMLAVQVRRGIDLRELKRQFAACEPAERWERRMEAVEGALEAAVERGLLVRRNGRFEPTDAGLSSADGLGLELAANLGG